MTSTELDTGESTSTSKSVASIVEDDEVCISLSALIKIITANISKEGEIKIIPTDNPYHIYFEIVDEDIDNCGEIFYDIERNTAYAISEGWRDRIEMIRESVLSPLRNEFEEHVKRAEELEEVMVSSRSNRPEGYDIVYPGYDFLGKGKKRKDNRLL